MITKTHLTERAGRPFQLHNPKRVITHAAGEFIINTELQRAQHAIDFFHWLYAQTGIAYHYLITPAGQIFELCDPKYIVSHAKDNNTNTIGVCWLVQGVHNEPTLIKRMTEQWVTNAQWSAGVQLYQQRFRDLVHQTHDEIDSRVDARGKKLKTDPGIGFNWQRFKDTIK